MSKPRVGSGIYFAEAHSVAEFRRNVTGVVLAGLFLAVGVWWFMDPSVPARQFYLPAIGWQLFGAFAVFMAIVLWTISGYRQAVALTWLPVLTVRKARTEAPQTVVVVRAAPGSRRLLIGHGQVVRLSSASDPTHPPYSTLTLTVGAASEGVMTVGLPPSEVEPVVRLLALKLESLGVRVVEGRP